MKKILLSFFILLSACTCKQDHPFHIEHVYLYAKDIRPTEDVNTLSNWRDTLARQPIESGKNIPTYATMLYVNYTINSKPYSHAPDFWPTPKEFADSPTTDCKGYAVNKYYALRKAGWKAKDLNLWSGDYEGHSHLILVANLNNQPYVLDIGAESNLPLAKDYFYKHFIPSYRFNENGWDIN